MPARRTILLVAAVLAVLGALPAGADAGARLIGPSTQRWRVDVVTHGAGVRRLAAGTTHAVPFHRAFHLGLQPFAFRVPVRSTTASAEVRATRQSWSVLAQAPTVHRATPRSPKGGVAHLDVYQGVEILSHGAKVHVAIDDLLLEAIDTNGPVTDSECPPGTPCPALRSLVHYRVHAWAVIGGRDLVDVGGTVSVEGHEGHWQPLATTDAASHGAFWQGAAFHVDRDIERSGVESHVGAEIVAPAVIQIPVGSLERGDLVMVHIEMDAEAIDDRGGESAVQAWLMDPLRVGPTVTGAGVAGRRLPRIVEPRARPLPSARCPAGAARGAGALQLSAPAYAVGEASGTPLVVVRRVGGRRGAASVTLSTRGGTARAGHDFETTRTVVRFEAGDASPRLVRIPIREDLAIEPAERFTVALSGVRCAVLGSVRSASVTILDDEPHATPPPTFTIGGTVDGLQGSGLVLSNLGALLPIAANGRFAFPGTAFSGEPYTVSIQTPPSNPDQACTVDHGTGHVGSTDVADIAVHCTAVATPGALDPTFGSSGRVSTPVGGGHGEAVVIQPTGRIVTAGWRTAGAGGATDFALTRHDAAGALDAGFGTSGIATTDIGGPGDQAHDAALLPDGGVIAVGETDAAGIQKQDFALVRYDADGHPASTFGNHGVVTTDLTGHGDIAYAVAVQGDGKIVVAGLAAGPSGLHADFAVARYTATGALDTTFSGDGIATTDFGALSDDIARAVAIQPDGRIVVVGTAGEDIAVARYLANGTPDGSFGTAGVVRTDLGSFDVGNGVAIGTGGRIVVSGYTVGAGGDDDFLAVGYHADGSLDTTFGDHGHALADFGGQDFAEDVAIDGSGRIVLVGRVVSSTILDMALARLDASGALDATFGDHGLLAVDFHGRGDLGQDVAVDGAGRYVAAGFTANGGDTQLALMRVRP